MSGRLCVCGCGRRGPHRHHVVTEQKIREVLRARSRLTAAERRRLTEAVADQRNLVWMHPDCHLAHHNALVSAAARLPLRVLPDSVFEFAAELFEEEVPGGGAGAAYEYLRRRYRGNDARLDALVSDGGA